MPELPEVETVRRGLNRLIKGKTIKDVNVLYDKIIVGSKAEFCKKLSGKYLLFRFSGDLTMVSHLRMEGKYFVRQKGEPVEKHTHVIFYLMDGSELHYNDVRKFGRMELFKTGEETTLSGISKLGPEPTEKNFDSQKFYEGLQKKKKPIKTALLDQTLVAGVGNIYADEVLYMAKIHPLTPCNELSRKQADCLRNSIIDELEKASEKGGTTIRSYANAFLEEGSFQFFLQVYGKTGEKCGRCGTPIEKIVVGQRGTHYCPNCQVMKK